ncbi:hypothetical protein TARUN_416 [Trichoderma arundinaceum]|uniref:Uncharacterized protein n=1 Tax=Trichoderma arundinaceum TaxID=490622 RepID=A0A395P0E6_TRIAR|nr:hypothetical protein TARUN_416 [Trichoderma arundinaceum]
MPTLRERKNPSAGTKVTPGQDAPVHREAVGIVASESLAAESMQHGGEFAQNPNTQPEVISSSDLKTQSGREGGGVAGEAPGYVADQYLTDTKGPHGRNVKEGISDEAGVKNDGLKRALRSEPGSEDDPSRLAERQMLQGQSLRDRGSGPRQSDLTGETSHHPDSRHHASMSTVPEEKSSLRLPRPPELDSRQQSRTQASTTEGGRRDVPRSTDVPSEEDIHAQEMEHQRYGEAQPQLVPTDMIETMITAKGRKTDSLGGA